MRGKIALAVVVALLDLIPLAGATIAAVIVSTVSFIELGWVRAVIVIGFEAVIRAALKIADREGDPHPAFGHPLPPS